MSTIAINQHLSKTIPLSFWWVSINVSVCSVTETLLHSHMLDSHIWTHPSRGRFGDLVVWVRCFSEDQFTSGTTAIVADSPCEWWKSFCLRGALISEFTVFAPGFSLCTHTLTGNMPQALCVCVCVCVCVLEIEREGSLGPLTIPWLCWHINEKHWLRAEVSISVSFMHTHAHTEAQFILTTFHNSAAFLSHCSGE